MSVTKKTAKKKTKAKAVKKTVKKKTVKAKGVKSKAIPEIKTAAGSGPIMVKFTRVDLENTLAVMRDFVDKSATMPILSHVYLGVSDTDCKLIGTNLDRFWKKSIDCKLIGTNLDRFWKKSIDCKQGGPVNRCVPLELLYSEVKALNEEIELVELEFDTSTVRVNGRCLIQTLPGDDYPAIPKGGETKAEITGLIEKSKRVLPATGDSDTRFTLNAVCLNLGKGHIVATDGHRLHMDDIEAFTDSPQVLVPSRVMELAVKHKASETIKYDKKHITFDLAGGQMVSRLIDGTFPNYENVIPKHNPISVKFNGAEMLKVLEGAIPVTKERSNAVRLTINGKIEVEALNPEGHHYKWAVASTTKGKKDTEDLVLGCNAVFLAKAIGAYISKEDTSVIMKIDKPLSPILINEKAVVMPMRS